MPANTRGAAAKLNNQSQRLSSLTPTLDHLYDKFQNGPKPASDFEKSLFDFMGVLYCQIKELRNDHATLRDEMLVRNRMVTDSVDDLHLSVVKTEQYSRRDTITVVGLDKPDTETEASLSQKVAQTLSDSGVNVAPEDFSAIHRNSRDSRVIKGRTVPPSVTVRFSKINKKDSVLRSYRNYNQAASAPRPVKIYQSLTQHYADLRSGIFKFLKSDENDEYYIDGPIRNVGLKPKWVTYQSPTSGFAVKLASGEYFNGIHVWQDFVKHIMTKFPDCRVN